MAFDYYNDPDFQGNYRNLLKSDAYTRKNSTKSPNRPYMDRRAFIKEGYEPKQMSDQESADYFQAQSEVVVKTLYELGIQSDRWQTYLRKIEYDIIILCTVDDIESSEIINLIIRKYGINLFTKEITNLLQNYENLWVKSYRNLSKYIAYVNKNTLSIYSDKLSKKDFEADNVRKIRTEIIRPGDYRGNFEAYFRRKKRRRSS